MAVSNAELLAELQALAAANGGESLSPRQVYEHARECRESAVGQWMGQKGAWDTDRAQELFGLELAARLLRRVKVVVTRERQEPRTVQVRAFYSLEERRGQGDGNPSYVAGELIFGDGRAAARQREELARTVLGQLQGIAARYRILGQLAQVWAAIDRAAGEIGRQAAG